MEKPTKAGLAQKFTQSFKKRDNLLDEKEKLKKEKRNDYRGFGRDDSKRFW
jgi:hypothetical protein